MRMTLVTAVAALPAFVAAAPPIGRIGTSIPITKRSNLVNADKTVNLDALNSHVAAVQAKILRGFANYEKSTGSPHPSALRGVNRRDAVPLTDDSEQLWYGTINVGIPPVNFTVDFDTGSSDLFIPGSNCDSSCDGHARFDPSASVTSQDLGKTFDLKYGDGSTVSGEQYTDNVFIAGLVAIGQTLGVASQYSASLSASQFSPDGLMGMAYESLSGFQASPIFQTLVSYGEVFEPVFSFNLATSGSELYLGGANPTLYTGDFTYTPVTTQGYWEVNMDSVNGNGQPILTNVDCIIDTGSTLIIGNPTDVANFYEAVGGTDASETVGQGFYTFPCDSFPDDVSLTFGGTTFPIPASSLNLGTISSGSTDCVSAIMTQNTGSSFWIIGDVFLSNVYTTFDLGNNQVGFATLA